MQGFVYEHGFESDDFLCHQMFVGMELFLNPFQVAILASLNNPHPDDFFIAL